MSLLASFFLLVVVAQLAQAGTLVGFGSGFKGTTFQNAFHSWTYDTDSQVVQLFENDDASLEPTGKSIMATPACPSRLLYVLIENKLISISQDSAVVSTSTELDLTNLQPGYLQYHNASSQLLLVAKDTNDDKVKIYTVNPLTGALTKLHDLDVDNIDSYYPSAISSAGNDFYWVDRTSWDLIVVNTDTGAVSTIELKNLPANTTQIRAMVQISGSLRTVAVTAVNNVNTYMEIEYETGNVNQIEEFPAGNASQTAFLRPGGYDKEEGIMYVTSSTIGGWYEVDIDPIDVLDETPNGINSAQGAPNTYGVFYLESDCAPTEETTTGGGGGGGETTIPETTENNIEIPDELLENCDTGFLGENCDIVADLLEELVEIWNPTDDLTSPSVEVSNFNFNGESVELDLNFAFTEDVFDGLSDIFFLFSGVDWNENDSQVNPFDTIGDEFDVLDIGFQIEFLDGTNQLVQPADGSAVFVEICPGLSDDELLAATLLFFDTALEEWLTTESACADGIENTVDIENGCVNFAICHTTQYQMVVNQAQTTTSSFSPTLSSFSSASSTTTTSSASMISSPRVWLSLVCLLLVLTF